MKKNKTHSPFRSMTPSRLSASQPVHPLPPHQQRSPFKTAAHSLDDLMASPQRRRYLASLGDAQSVA